MMAKKPSGGGGATYDDYFGEIPPESTSFGFPLYITVPFEGYVGEHRYYQRAADNISLQLFEWANENKVVVDETFNATSYEVYPDNLYINGRKVEYMYTEEDKLMGGGITDWNTLIESRVECSVSADGTILIIFYD